MKNLTLCFLLLFLNTQTVLAEPDYNAEDFTFDPTTSTLVAKFMGKVMLIRGKVSAENDKGTRKLKKGEKIYRKDLITTARNGIIKIELVDQTTITLNKNSAFNVSEWNFNPQKGERDAVINLLKGQMRTHFKVKAQKRNKLEVKVNNISMGVRGTKILANAMMDQKGHEITQVALIEGYGRLHDKNRDFQENMKTGDHYISVIGPEESKTTMEKIPSKIVNQLLAAGKNPKKNFFPFLGNFDIKKMGMKKSKSNNSKGSSGDSSNNSGPKKDNWKDKMKKLNKSLQEERD